MNWFDYILQEGSAELANRREIERLEAEAKLKTLSGADMATSTLGRGIDALPSWALPAAIGVAVLAVAYAVMK